MKDKISYSGFTFKLNPPFGISLEISKLGFLTVAIPDVYYTKISKSGKEFKHKEFEYDIFKSEIRTGKKKNKPEKKDKNSFFMKPFESKSRWQQLEDDNLVFCHQDDFVKDIIKKRKIPHIFRKFLLISLIAMVLSFLIYEFLGLFVLSLFLFSVKEVANFDDRRVISVIFYDFDNESETAYKSLLNTLKQTKEMELVKSQGKKEKVNIKFNLFDLLKTNVDTASLLMQEGTLLILPDKLIAFMKNGSIVSHEIDEIVFKSGKVKTKDDKVKGFLSVKGRGDFHLLFYTENVFAGDDLKNSLNALQNKKHKPK